MLSFTTGETWCSAVMWKKHNDHILTYVIGKNESEKTETYWTCAKNQYGASRLIIMNNCGHIVEILSPVSLCPLSEVIKSNTYLGHNSVQFNIGKPREICFYSGSLYAAAPTLKFAMCSLHIHTAVLSHACVCQWLYNIWIMGRPVTITNFIGWHIAQEIIVMNDIIAIEVLRQFYATDII